MIRNLLPVAGVALLLIASSASLPAKVTLPPLFGSKMVLQRQMPVPVWGEANPGEKITVTLDKFTATATADDKGRWIAKLPAMEAGGPYTLSVKGEDVVTFTDVMVGEVWICSGQSNMEMGVGAAKNKEEEIVQAGHPGIRLFRVAHHVAAQPATTCTGEWIECSPKTIASFTATGYFFGRDLHEKLKVPVGLIEAAWGGTLIEFWIPKDILESDPDFKPILDRYAAQLSEYPPDWEDYDKKMPKALKAWNDAKAKAAGLPAPKSPTLPPSGIYNGEIATLAPFAIRGVIWYQGESNAPRGLQYGKLLPAMIKSWRQLWGEGDFAFLVAQLPNFMPPKPEPGPSNWAELREAETKVLALPNTEVTVNIDIGEEKGLHPRDKQDVGRRLALAAEKLVYKLDVFASGPVYKAMHVDGATVKIEFDNAAGLKTKDGGPILGFALAGTDQNYVWATGKVEGHTVVLHAEGVTQPVAVRYDWADFPNGNLYNAADLPTRPFRTDDWPVNSTGKN